LPERDEHANLPSTRRHSRQTLAQHSSNCRSRSSRRSARSRPSRKSCARLPGEDVGRPV